MEDFRRYERETKENKRGCGENEFSQAVIMSWNIVHIIEVVFAVVLGGCITLWVNLYLQSRERKKQYAIWNKDKIYIPLYDEIKLKHKRLDFFEDPFNAATTLDSWANFKPSTQLRIPQDLQRLIDKFDKKARDYYEAYRNAEEVLHKRIEEQVDEAKDELRVDHPSILVRNIFEGYRGDFFVGEIFKNRRHNYPPERILPLRNGSSLTFEVLFRKICSSIKKESEIIKLEGKRHHLMEPTQNLEKYLESKIKYIQRKFESKPERI